MLSFITDRVASSQNNRIVQTNGMKGLATTVNSNGAALQAPCLRSYSDVFNLLLKKYANNKAIAEADVAILRSTQTTSMAF